MQVMMVRGRGIRNPYIMTRNWGLVTKRLFLWQMPLLASSFRGWHQQSRCAVPRPRDMSMQCHLERQERSGLPALVYHIVQ